MILNISILCNPTFSCHLVLFAGLATMSRPCLSTICHQLPRKMVPIAQVWLPTFTQRKHYIAGLLHFSFNTRILRTADTSDSAIIPTASQLHKIRNNPKIDWPCCYPAFPVVSAYQPRNFSLTFRFPFLNEQCRASQQ